MNKVQFGLVNVHLATITETYDKQTNKWSTTYGTPVAVPGAVKISLSKEIAKTIFRADNSNYYVTEANNGYTGNYELAKFPASLFVDVFGQRRDDKGLLVESIKDKTKPVAMMFEIDGDESATKYCLFKVQLEKPNIEGETTGETIDVKTDSLDLTVLPRLDDGNIKCIADETTDAQTYADFYNAVPTVAFTDSEG